MEEVLEETMTTTTMALIPHDGTDIDDSSIIDALENILDLPSSSRNHLDSLLIKRLTSYVSHPSLDIQVGAADVFAVICWDTANLL